MRNRKRTPRNLPRTTFGSTRVSTYRRQDVLRIFEIGPRQLQAWERAGLIPQQEIYSFQDLGQLRILCVLRAEAVPAASIRESILAMKAVSGMANPLLETRVMRTGSRLAFRHQGAMVDPVRGQLLFDFERGGQQEAVTAAMEPEPLRRPAPAGPRVIQERFLAAVRAEESSDKQHAIALYEEILSLDPDYAAAAINLGTIYFHLRQYGRAEEFYRRARGPNPAAPLGIPSLAGVGIDQHRLA